MKTLSFRWSDTLNTLYIYVTKFTMENSLLKKVSNIWKKIHLRTCIVYVGASLDTMTILYKTLMVEFFLSFETWSVWKIKAGNYNYTLLDYFSGVKVVLVRAFLGFNALTTAHFGVNFTASRRHLSFSLLFYNWDTLFKEIALRKSELIFGNTIYMTATVEALKQNTLWIITFFCYVVWVYWIITTLLF